MTIRSLDLLDLPVIARYRNDVLTLDSARALTRGQPLGAAGLLAYVNPARHLYAAIVNGGESALLGGVIHTRGDSFAKLLYLAPSSHLDHSQLPAMIEHLSAQAGDQRRDLFAGSMFVGMNERRQHNAIHARRHARITLLFRADKTQRAAWRRLDGMQQGRDNLIMQILHRGQVNGLGSSPSRFDAVVFHGRI